MKTALRVLGSFGLALLAVTCTRDSPTSTVSLEEQGGGPAADRVLDAPSGTLNLCKVAGPGLTAGESFIFSVTQGGVSRGVAVATGSCAPLEIPRESAPLSKGYFKAKPDAVSRLLSGATTLLVDGTALSNTQVQAILGGAANVSVTSTLLLNLTQQLIAADLNVLRGVQPSAQVQQAIADANAAIQVAVDGAEIEITTSLTTAQQSDLVDLLTAFNDGKTKPPVPPASVALQIVEAVGSLAEVTAIVCEPAANCANADLGAGSVTATIASGETTVVSYTNKARPVLRVCKVAGAGVEAGTVFRIGAVALGLNSGTTDFDVPAGECRDAAVEPGPYFLQEVIPDGVAVSAIACEPADRCSTPIVSDGVISVSVVDAATTRVTYTNRSTIGTLGVCKVAGTGVETGAVYRISAVALGLNSGTTNFDVPAGECREAALVEGPYLLQEVIAPGTVVSSITCEPACSSPNLTNGIVSTSVVALSTTTVTYTNTSTLGTLRVCKVAGAGITEGTVFRIGAVGLAPGGVTNSFDVPAGDCLQAQVPAGPYFLQEVIPAGIAVSAIGCEPAAACGPPIVPDGVVSASVQAQTTTTVTYTNRSTLGTLRVCKVAGAGVTEGTVFRIGAVGLAPGGVTNSFDVPAGDCLEAQVPAGPYFLQEVIPAGIAVSAIGCEPAAACGPPIVPDGVVSASVQAQTTTTVTYTNSASAALNASAQALAPTAAPPPVSGRSLRPTTQ